MRRLSALFFDVDDTLYSSTEFTEMAHRNAVRAMIQAGLRVAEERAMAELCQVIGEFSSNYEQHFNVLLTRLPPLATVGLNPALLVAAGVVAYHDTKVKDLRPYEDAEQVLRQLSASPLRLGVITTGWPAKQAEKLVRLGLAPYFEPGLVFIADQMGVHKTNPKLYTRICDLAAIDPETAMHVGDRPDRDIDPAKEAGLITVRNLRSGRYLAMKGRTKPDYEINNFFDLLEIVRRDFTF